jgi:Xaa-Pro dipeptidase
MAVHFSADELAQRRAATCRGLSERGLDGLLMFRQESMFYLTGYDSFGYVFFQCLYLAADGGMTLLTRAPDLRQARQTSVIDDIRIWVDKDGVDPTLELRGILDEHGARGAKLGVELEAYGLTGRNWRRLAATLEGFCDVEDASDLVSRQRLVKSAAELGYVRRAAELADAALEAAWESAGPGAFEGDILAAMQGAVFAGGGDYPANEYIIASGADALLCRYFSGRRTLDADDQLTLEFAGTYRHYHACLMRLIRIGPPGAAQSRMYATCQEALAESMAALKPGAAMGAVFDAHARVFDAAGYQAHRLNACGYSLGATFSPNWMDWPMFYADNPVEAAPGMVFFLHMILADSEAGLGASVGETVVVTETGCQRLTRSSLDLVIN